MNFLLFYKEKINSCWLAKTIDTKFSSGGYYCIEKGVDNDGIAKSHNYRMLIVGILIICI